jgi:hypothetical protein
VRPGAPRANSSSSSSSSSKARVKIFRESTFSYTHTYPTTTIFKPSYLFIYLFAYRLNNKKHE